MYMGCTPVVRVDVSAATWAAAYLRVLTWTSGASGVALLALDVDTVGRLFLVPGGSPVGVGVSVHGSSYLQVYRARCGSFARTYSTYIISRVAAVVVVYLVLRS